MREEIEKALLRLKIEGKETRKRMARHILIFSILVAFFSLVPYFYSQLTSFWTLDALIIVFGGIYVVFEAIPTLYDPLIPEYNAFKKIARAIQTLEKSNEPIAYEEAYRCLKHTNKILKAIELDNLEWYEEINQTLKRFLDNLELIVLPAISNSIIKTEHLEEIALAVFSINSEKIKAVNKTLESESSYKKYPKPPRKIEIFTRRFRESIIGKLLYSLALGYGLVLTICLIYVVATEQDFMIFARERPDIVVLGGLIASGITFWKTKPQSEWKSA